jgi:tetratricopeptide (TPR) repeat protein
VAFLALLYSPAVFVLLAESSAATPDPVSAALKMLINWLLQYGVSGVVVAVVLLIWWQWPKIKDLPGVASLAGFVKDRLIQRKRLIASSIGNRPRGDRFSIALARLINDNESGDSKTLILEELKTFPGIEVLNVDSEISDGDVKAGHEKARDMLNARHADAIIWGRVIKFGGGSVPKLYLTFSSDDALNKVDNYKPTEDFKLPELFWNNLKQILGLVVATADSRFGALKGHYTADQLAPHIARVRHLLDTQETWTQQQRAPIEYFLASALFSLGEQSGDNGCLRESIDAYRNALLEHTRDRVPLDWAATQNNLGSVLSTLGERESGTGRLEEAVTAYRDALLERTRDRVPLDWAMTQNNLGGTLSTLGERESGTARLEEAVTAFRDALLEYTRDRVPLDWAMTENNLGGTLSTLGERESGTARLEEAVTTFRDALLEYTRDRVPLNWATTQNNLGNALSTLGERESGTGRLEEAVTAYRDALLERTRDRVPLNWAMTQNNLGNALSTLGERESGTARLEEAVTAFRDALLERTHDRVPLDWAMTQNNLGSALLRLGQRESGTARLEEAVTAFRDALLEYTRDRVPLDWAMTNNNLDTALKALETKRRGPQGKSLKIN